MATLVELVYDAAVTVHPPATTTALSAALPVAHDVGVSAMSLNHDAVRPVS
jgi:hypothetical protein